MIKPRHQHRTRVMPLILTGLRRQEAPPGAHPHYFIALCDCGWESDAQASETDAGNAANDHIVAAQ